MQICSWTNLQWAVTHILRTIANYFGEMERMLITTLGWRKSTWHTYVSLKGPRWNRRGVYIRSWKHDGEGDVEEHWREDTWVRGNTARGNALSVILFWDRSTRFRGCDNGVSVTWHIVKIKKEIQQITEVIQRSSARSLIVRRAMCQACIFAS